MTKRYFVKHNRSWQTWEFLQLHKYEPAFQPAYLAAKAKRRKQQLITFSAGVLLCAGVGGYMVTKPRPSAKDSTPATVKVQPSAKQSTKKTSTTSSSVATDQAVSALPVDQAAPAVSAEPTYYDGQAGQVSEEAAPVKQNAVAPAPAQTVSEEPVEATPTPETASTDEETVESDTTPSTTEAPATNKWKYHARAVQEIEVEAAAPTSEATTDTSTAPVQPTTPEEASTTPAQTTLAADTETSVVPTEIATP